MADHEVPFPNFPLDAAFLEVMADRVSRPFTPAEKQRTQEVWEDIRLFQEVEKFIAFMDLEGRIKQTGIEFKDPGVGSESRNFRLAYPPFDLDVFQSREGTVISFPRDPRRRLDAYSMQYIFFSLIPKALYGFPADSEEVERIRSSTVGAVYKGITEYHIPFNRAGEAFAAFRREMETGSDLRSVRLYSDDPGASYSLQITNPNQGVGEYVRFQFGTDTPMTKDMMELLLDLHPASNEIEGEAEAYYSTFTAAINEAQDFSRVYST